MGVFIINTEPFIGVVIDKPLKNKSILAATPNMAQTTNFSKSVLSLIFSFMNDLWNKKINTLATETLNKMKAKGLMYNGITCLAILKVAP
jgi:hypothetical protein